MPPSLRLDQPTHTPSLISNTTVWTGVEWVADADVRLAGGRVAAITPHHAAAGTDGSAIDGRDRHLIPGFVNTHTHVQQSLCRGVGEGQQLLAWLLAIGEAMRAVDPERAYLATVSAALEGLLSGTTTLVEHGWPHPDTPVWEAVASALTDVGVRATLGVGIADRPDPTRKWGFDPLLMKPVDEIFDDVDLLRSLTADTRISPALAVPNPRTLTAGGMKLVRAYAEEHDLTAMIHFAETGTDDAMCREHAGMEAVDVLAEADFLWDRLLAVHGVELTPRAVSLFAEGGVALAWNPVSNMRLGSGVAPIGDYLAAGMAVSLGVDGAGSNDRQDMLESIRTGAYVQRATHKQADLFGFAQMLALATDGAAKTLGVDLGQSPMPGGVTVGRPADLTLLRFDRDFACLPVLDPGASLLTTGTPRIVDTVIVGGEVVVADGRSTRIDVEALTAALLLL